MKSGNVVQVISATVVYTLKTHVTILFNLFSSVFRVLFFTTLFCFCYTQNTQLLFYSVDGQRNIVLMVGRKFIMWVFMSMNFPTTQQNILWNIELLLSSLTCSGARQWGLERMKFEIIFPFIKIKSEMSILWEGGKKCFQQKSTRRRKSRETKVEFFI